MDYEEDGYRKNDGRFVFHDSYNMNWEFGSNHREWTNPDVGPRDSAADSNTDVSLEDEFQQS